MTSPSPADRVVDALVSAHLLDPADRADSRAVVSDVLDTAPVGGVAPARSGMPLVVEVVAYLGGALVLAAGALFLEQQWAELAFAARVSLLGVVSLVLGAAGAVTTRVPATAAAATDSRRRLGGALLAAAALAVAFLVGHVTDEVLQPGFDGVYWPAVVGATVGSLVAVAGYRRASTAVGLLAILAGAFTATVTLGSGADLPGSEGDWVGLGAFLVGVLWLAAAEAGWFEERTIARALGAATLLLGAQIPVMDGTHAWLGYTLTLVVALAGVAAYLRQVSWPYLAMAVLAVTLVVPEAVSDWTEGSLGAVGGVLVAGVTLLLASAAGYRVRAEANG